MSHNLCTKMLFPRKALRVRPAVLLPCIAAKIRVYSLKPPLWSRRESDGGFHPHLLGSKIQAVNIHVPSPHLVVSHKPISGRECPVCQKMPYKSVDPHDLSN
uniref:Uncharacterized protein n=1 Tax=Sphaerodactylus townsendi TaxID=933632 RepID=A0ACB8FK50_9SAUR